MNGLVAALLAAASGAAAGSFGAAAAERLARGADWVAEPSRCRACGRRLGARDLVPLLSWLALRGRCRGCGAAIPARLLAAEAAGAGLGLWAAATVPAPLLWPSLGLACGLLVLGLVDLATLRLPRPLTGGLLALGLLTVALGIGPDLLPAHLAAALGGWAVFEGLALLWLRLRGREGLGRGDALLAAAGGAWLGPAGLPSAILLAALAGIAAALLSGRGAGASQPFGPFLGLGIWVTWAHGPLLP